MALLNYRDVTDVFVDARPTLESLAARRAGCRETGRDIVQDMFLRLDRLTARFASHHDARCFLVRMTLNAATDHDRVERRRAEIIADVLPVPETDADAETAAITSDAMRRIDVALAELPQKCRDVLYLIRIEGMTHSEVAAKLGVSRSLVDKYAVRALLHCRRQLQAEQVITAPTE